MKSSFQDYKIHSVVPPGLPQQALLPPPILAGSESGCQFKSVKQDLKYQQELNHAGRYCFSLKKKKSTQGRTERNRISLHCKNPRRIYSPLPTISFLASTLIRLSDKTASASVFGESWKRVGVLKACDQNRGFSPIILYPLEPNQT